MVVPSSDFTLPAFGDWKCESLLHVRESEQKRKKLQQRSSEHWSSFHPRPEEKHSAPARLREHDGKQSCELALHN
ncbi:uncharacterized [Tachysurus ichikawai]